MFGLHLIGSLFLALNGNQYSFQDASLKIAADAYRDAQQLASEGKHKEACDEFMSGIFIGRSTVQKLFDQKQGGGDPDDQLQDETDDAIDWLISSYISLFKARIAMNDWTTARADAWAACNYSMNENLEALYCMLLVCKRTNDAIGEIQTLRLVSALQSDPSTAQSEIWIDGIEVMTTDEIDERIQVLEEKLSSK